MIEKGLAVSTPKMRNSAGLIPAPPAGARPPRGWPVVATGSGGRTPEEERARLAWRRLHALPEESENFSDRDALDLADAILRRSAREELPARLALALERGSRLRRPIADIRPVPGKECA